MKPDDRVFLAENIGNYQIRFEIFVKGFKKDDFKVLGYARKSPSDLPTKTLKKILQNMIDCLRNRSLVESVYVSPNSPAKSLIPTRDMKITDEELANMELEHCAGSTQALLKYLSSTDKKVCLIIVDYAALSTVPDDVQAFVKNNKSLEYIVVDRLREARRYEVYRRLQILRTPECLNSFKFRCNLSFYRDQTGFSIHASPTNQDRLSKSRKYRFGGFCLSC